MSAQSSVVTIPDVQLTIDQLIAGVRQLERPARIHLARILLETEMDAKLADLIRNLAQKPAVDEISDEDIMAEIQAVRDPVTINPR